MPSRPSPAQLLPWLSLCAAVLAAGMYVGRLDQRITNLEALTHYMHGSFVIPKGAE